MVGAIMSKYNAQEQTPHKQRLVWRLSSRTARILRPTDKFTSVLPAIAEHAPVPSPSKIRYLPETFVARMSHRYVHNRVPTRVILIVALIILSF